MTVKELQQALGVVQKPKASEKPDIQRRSQSGCLGILTCGWTTIS